MGRGRGARVSEFFSKNLNLKKIFFFFFWGGGGGGGWWSGWGGGGGSSVSKFLFKESKSKNRIFLWWGE